MARRQGQGGGVLSERYSDEWYAEQEEARKRLGYDLATAFECHGGQPITVEDIEAIDKQWPDGRDEPEFAWLLKLKDGRWAAASGGHDYTGWECQSSLSVTVHPTREDALRWGFDLNMREMLGELLPDDKTPTAEELLLEVAEEIRRCGLVANYDEIGKKALRWADRIKALAPDAAKEPRR